MDNDKSQKKARLDDPPTSDNFSEILPLALKERFETIRQWIAKPIDSFRDEDGIFRDPFPATVMVKKEANDKDSSSLLEDTGVLIGNKYHASDVDNLVNLGVTAVLNCASGGISRLPVNELRERGIRYGFTNVRQDDLKYPILHQTLPETMDQSPLTLEASQHLEVAKAMYVEEVVLKKGKLLFFCVAGQNRSATLALATLLLRGKPNYNMDSFCQSLGESRAFVLENEGFQKQLLELEWYLQQPKRKRKHYAVAGNDTSNSFPLTMHAHGDPPRKDLPPSIVASPSFQMLESLSGDHSRSHSMDSLAAKPIDARERVEIELLIPGLCTMEAMIPVPSTIGEVKQHLIDHVNNFLLKGENKQVAKSWVVLAVFGKDAEYDLPLEEEAIESSVQWDRLSKMFGLKTEESKDDSTTKVVHWSSLCRFALVIFSVYNNPSNDSGTETNDDLPRLQEPWTFVHRERPGAPATLLENTLVNTKLRGWDFCDGQAFESKEPIVFSFSPDPRDKRQFMKISTKSQEAQQFHAPGEGGILGMGANAIVHRVELKSTSPRSFDEGVPIENEAGNEEWDAAVKRPFSLSKMLASLEAGSEAGLGKRLRQLSHRSLLNSDGRILYFYGLGVALSSNAYRPNEYKFEAAILARYEAEFSTYTMKRFMQDYISHSALPPSREDDKNDKENDWRDNFSLISVKVLLVSLLNAFRDLTLMGVQAFDFNHLNNVLVSRDFQSVKLLDIDGDSRGSIPLSEYMSDSAAPPSASISHTKRRASVVLHKPSLDIDLNAVLPTVVQQLLLGKRRGTSFVTNTKSTIWRLPPEEAKKVIEETVSENFGPLTERHMAKVVEWFYAMLKKQPPWGNWTHDIYDAMRCIDHLPVR